jgi:hypothetical protein
VVWPQLQKDKGISNTGLRRARVCQSPDAAQPNVDRCAAKRPLGFIDFALVTSKDFCIATPALHKPVPQLRQIFIKNIKPKFHFGQQLSSLVAGL